MVEKHLWRLPVYPVEPVDSSSSKLFLVYMFVLTATSTVIVSFECYFLFTHFRVSLAILSIHCDLAKDLPQIMADRIQLQQVFMNLMLNGIEAMKEVGTPGKLTIRTRRDENGQLLVSVVDTGVGLQQEQAERIFDTFFTTKSRGTGMGLPISRSIIESHGGHLSATSNSGPGATFHFNVPIEIAAH